MNPVTKISPSPLNGESAGVRGGNDETLSPWKVSRCAHPSPSIPLPVEGRGKSAGSRPSVVILSLILSVASLSGDPTTDLVLKNANVYTVSEKQLRAEAIAVKDARIIFVGSNLDAAKHETGARVIDLK